MADREVFVVGAGAAGLTAAQAVEWFERELGVPLKLEETGKYFPVSDDGTPCSTRCSRRASARA